MGGRLPLSVGAGPRGAGTVSSLSGELAVDTRVRALPVTIAAGWLTSGFRGSTPPPLRRRRETGWPTVSCFTSGWDGRALCAIGLRSTPLKAARR